MLVQTALKTVEYGNHYQMILIRIKLRTSYLSIQLSSDIKSSGTTVCLLCFCFVFCFGFSYLVAFLFLVLFVCLFVFVFCFCYCFGGFFLFFLFFFFFFFLLHLFFFFFLVFGFFLIDWTSLTFKSYLLRLDMIESSL